MHRRFARPLRTLSAAGPISLLEVAVMAGVLVALAVVAFGRHVIDGGFWNDDWANVAAYHFAESPRYLTSVGDYAELLGSRPILAALLPLPYALFGLDPTPHLVMAVVLGVATCLAFFLFLRALPVARVHAGAMACMALVFPWADSIRLWPTASVNTVALVFAFLGAFFALRGIEGDGRRATAELVAAAVLYALSVLTYEVAGFALLLVGILYLTRAPRRRAVAWWGIHGAVIVATLLYTVATTEKAVGTLGDRLADLPAYTRQTITLFSYSFLPPGTSSAPAKLAALLLVGAMVVAALWRYRASRDRQLAFWIVFGSASAAAIACAYLVTLGAFLEPLREGVYNRGNLFAAYAFVGLVYALAMVVVRIFGGHRVAGAAAAAGVALVVTGYVVRVRDDSSEWIRAVRYQQPVVAAAVEASRDLPAGASVFTFGYPSQLSKGVPIFYLSWDLDGAVALRLDDRSANAYPVYDTATLTCRPSRIAIVYPHSDSKASADYRATAFVDVVTREARRIRSAADCADALRSFRPGPEYDDRVLLGSREVGSAP